MHRLKNHKSYEKQQTTYHMKRKIKRKCKHYRPKDGNNADDEDDEICVKRKKEGEGIF